MDNTLLTTDQSNGTMPTPSQDNTSSMPSASSTAPIPHRVAGDNPSSPSSDTDSAENSPSSSSSVSTAASTVDEQDEIDTEDTSLASSSPSSTPKHEADYTYPLPPATSIPERVLDQDKNTPDAHVPRDPRLIRLTGVHPFNVEPPLTDLYNQGFLTSPELFYVRNHGAVPQVQDDEMLDWEFSVEGCVENPFTLTLRELMSSAYDNVTYPVTLVCAGNRRKEQNVVKKSKGFSWGAAGLSTALFTGVAMADVIKKARPTRRARYVCMEGADKLPNGYYGTSVKLNWVMDPNRGIMLAHGMNGEPLRLDHGKPLRAVVPGQIGGRSVKWLKKLIVTEEPSDNWYHIYDNRVLPTTISPEESASNPAWWMDERYAIYDLSPNSAIAFPAHNETLSLIPKPETTVSTLHHTEPLPPSDSNGPSYTLKGYAYGGGGRRITRVEVTLNKGKSWILADISYPEDAYRSASQADVSLFGGRIDTAWRETAFCWCFYSLTLSLETLANCDDIMVRSMDEAMCIQPRDMYWSVLGMMNNPWFRVVVHKEDEGQTLRFEHPTQPALMPGGWMERVKKAGGDLSNGFWGESVGGGENGGDLADGMVKEEEKKVEMKKVGVDRVIEIEELREHEKAEEPWFVVNGEVYDGTPFLQGHPGGAQSIVSAAGGDTSDEFMAIHSATAQAMMPTYHIGTLSAKARKLLLEPAPSSSEGQEPRPTFLNPKSWSRAILHAKKTVSWDTRIFTFALDHSSQSLGLPTGQHLMMRLRDPVSRESIIRSYTPISHESKKGFVDILVKVYFPSNEAGKVQAGGKMSTALEGIPVGHAIDIKGPIGKFEYLGRGRCTVNGTERNVKNFVMICGGSGVTPVYQVFRAVMQDRDDSTHCTLLDGNRLVEDILCKEELDEHARGNEHKCKLVYTLTKPNDEWKGLKGRIGEELLKEHAHPELDLLQGVEEEEGGKMALVCGPEALERSVREHLLKMGWKEEELLFF